MTARAKVKKRHPQAWCCAFFFGPFSQNLFAIYPFAHISEESAIGVGLTEREAWESAAKRTTEPN